MLAAGASAAFGAKTAIENFRHYIRRRTVDRAFHILFSDILTNSVNIICPIQRVGTNVPNITTHDDLLACIEIVVPLTERGISFKVALPDDVKEVDKKRDLMLICGPVGNAMTEEFFNTYTAPYRFIEDENGKLVLENSITRAKFSPSGGEFHDFALIAKLPNPWNMGTGCHVYIAAGIHGLGTRKSAEYLMKNAPEIVKTIRKNRQVPKNFAAILECTSASDKSTTGVKIRDFVVVE